MEKRILKTKNVLLRKNRMGKNKDRCVLKLELL